MGTSPEEIEFPLQMPRVHPEELPLQVIKPNTRYEEEDPHLLQAQIKEMSSIESLVNLEESIRQVREDKQVSKGGEILKNIILAQTLRKWAKPEVHHTPASSDFTLTEHTTDLTASELDQ